MTPCSPHQSSQVPRFPLAFRSRFETFITVILHQLSNVSDLIIRAILSAILAQIHTLRLQLPTGYQSLSPFSRLLHSCKHELSSARFLGLRGCRDFEESPIPLCAGCRQTHRLCSCIAITSKVSDRTCHDLDFCRPKCCRPCLFIHIAQQNSSNTSIIETEYEELPDTYRKQGKYFLPEHAAVQQWVRR
jgi:hypothetical protein